MNLAVKKCKVYFNYLIQLILFYLGYFNTIRNKLRRNYTNKLFNDNNWLIFSSIIYRINKEKQTNQNLIYNKNFNLKSYFKLISFLLIYITEK